MKLTQKFTLSGNLPEPGGQSAIWMSLKPQEVADAETAGTGAGVPSDTGTPTPGTIVPGMLLQLNSSGNVEAATQANLSAAFAKLYLVAWTGDDDNSGAFVGNVICFAGARFETEMYDAGIYTPGVPVVASSGTAGNFMQKAAFGDNIQAVGFVGPLGVTADNVLDVITLQGSGI